ncbi:TolC family protein [Desulfurobacterium thermolithotrophum]|uniref:TolC family protein n=1 Tax=Desulfurobacterium thermolithotrophum TaxID=64160 RepID=UPI0013D5A922|nr:TolC family protein [Desulfurobacterium thermolithotrophum]
MKKLILLIALIPSLSMAKTVSDLKSLLEIAIKNNPEIKLSGKEKEISNYQFKEAIGNFLPKVKLQYTKTFLSDVPTYKMALQGLPSTKFSVMEKNFYTLNLSLTQPLFTGGKLTYNLKMKEELKTVSFYQFQETVLKVLTNVKKDYYNLSEAKSAVEIAESYLQAAKRHLKDVKAFFDEGIVPKRDLLEAKVRVRDAEEQLEKARRTYKVALEKLKNDVGINDIEIKVEKLEYLPVNLTEKELLHLAFENRPLLKYLRSLKKSTDYAVKLSYSQFLPNIVLNLSYDRTNQYPMNGNFDNTAVGITIQLPIFEGIQRFWKVKEAKTQKAKAEISIKKAKDLIKLQVISAYTALKAAEARIKTAKIMVEEAKELLRDSEERYKEHVGTSTEVTDAIAYYVKAKGYLNSALADYNRALADLEYAVGKSMARRP